MEAIKTFNNASVVSVNCGVIKIKVNSELYEFKKASLISVCNGTVTIEYAEPLTEDILKAGRIVEQRNGARKLVLKDHSGRAVLIGDTSWASHPLGLDGEYKIIRVYEGYAEGAFSDMLRNTGDLVWSE